MLEDFNAETISGALPELGSFHAQSRAKAADVAYVIGLIADRHDIPVRLMMHKSRCSRRVAHLRQLAMYLIHVCTGRSMTEVATFFGRDRTTVRYACACVEDRREDAMFDDSVCALEEAIADAGFLPGGMA